MFQPRPCGCKGIRTCLVCEKEESIKKLAAEKIVFNLDVSKCLEYCHLCGKGFNGSDVATKHPDHDNEVGFEFPGVLLIPDFITKEEENILVQGCDSIPWDLSQSGRRKQNFGPKTNFKKKKISGKTFIGFPEFSKFVQEKFRDVKLLSNFITIEQCAIEYKEETGAHIDPHIDDCWVWGENVVSVSLISDSYLTMTKYQGDSTKYNLSHHYKLNRSEPCFQNNCSNFPIVRIPMPARSLLVLYGPARYEWEHCVVRKDIKGRRICLAYREFTKEYIEGGALYDDVGKEIINKSTFFPC